MDTPVRFAVLDRRPGVAVRFESGPGGLLELVHHPAYLRIARVVLRGPGDDPRRVLVLELKPISHRGHLVGIAPQHGDFFRVLFRVLFGGFLRIWLGGSLTGEVIHRGRRRPGPASQKLDHHGSRSPSTVSVSSARSMATRCATTSSASAASR